MPTCLSRAAMGWLAIVWLLAAPALAHKPSDSYLRIDGSEERLTVEWDIAIKDLDFLMGLDANQNGEITWGEVKQQRQNITALALSRLKIGEGGHESELQVNDLLVTKHSDGAYVVLMIETDCPGDAAELTISYSLFFDVDPTHRGLALYSNGLVTSTHVLSPTAPVLRLRTGEFTLWKSFVDYTREGVRHIWIGFDHILFLLSLLLPAVFIRRDARWEPVVRFRPACWSVLKIVSMFTLAHSITLWLAVMEYVTLPGQWVESAIALSIVITSLNNLYHLLPLSNWVIAFVFGLVHGFGFANVLIDLGLSSGSLAVALLGFNVGVELGQMVIVLVFLPLAFMLRGTWFYRWAVFRLGSVIVAIIAGLWMIERVFNREILGF